MVIPTFWTESMKAQWKMRARREAHGGRQIAQHEGYRGDEEQGGEAQAVSASSADAHGPPGRDSFGCATFRNFCVRNFLSYSIISSPIILKLGQEVPHTIEN